MNHQLVTRLLLIAGFFAAAPAAFAHVSLQDPAAAAGSSYRAVLGIGHGCAGSSTTAIKVLLPAGFNGAQAMAKPGWTVTTQSGPLDQPYEMHGKRFTQGVQEISWTAQGPANALPDALYDEFVLRGITPSKAGTLWFKVIQSCEKGSNPWTEIPSAGKDAHALEFPAARLDVLDLQAGPAHSH